MTTHSIDFSTLPPAQTDFGIHSLEKAAACPAYGFFSAREKALARSIREETGQMPPDDFVAYEGPATGTVGHALMAWAFSGERLAMPIAEVADLIRGNGDGDGGVALLGRDAPSVRNANWRLARYAAAYAYARVRVCFVDPAREVLGVEVKHAMTVKRLNGLSTFPLTGGLDILLDLSGESVSRFKDSFGTVLKPGLSVFDWKFIDYVGNAYREVNGHQHLSYQLLASNKCGTPVRNFVYACVAKTTAEKRAPNNDMILVRKDLPTLECAAEKIAILERDATPSTSHDADYEPGRTDYKIGQCVNHYGKHCRFSPAEGGPCHQGLTFALGE